MRLPPARTMRCLVCSRQAEDFHHRLPRSRGGPDDAFNMVPLCHAHHMHLHANPQWARDEGLTVTGYMDRDGRYVGADPAYLAHYGDGRRGEAA